MASAVPSKKNENVADIISELASFSNSSAPSTMGGFYETNLRISNSSGPVSSVSPDSISLGLQNHTLPAPNDMISAAKQPNKPSSNPAAVSDIQDHLRRLQEITDAARERAKRAEQPPVQPEKPKLQQATSPSTITEWAPALRHVSRLAARDPDLEKTIRRIILNQESHLKTWWTQRGELREAIKQGQSSASELANFDAKIYKAQVDMHSSMIEEFRYLGIPFFGMPVALIVRDETASQGKLTATQLRKLQSKMLEYLQTMYGPE